LSFIEKNKVWLLPLLGLGILGVGYLNFQTLRGDQPPAALAEAAVPVEAEPAAVALSPEGTETTEALWNDLLPFAILPGNLAQEGALTDRARLALGPELDGASPLLLGRPAWAALAPLPPKPGGLGTTQDLSGEGPPELDFLIHGPHGSYAWFGGKAYRTGEKLLDSGYTLSRIGPTFVELTGPQGRIVESTHALGQHLSHPVEMP
jgi:hypothetical protein